jgi:hypothetical protein
MKMQNHVRPIRLAIASFGLVLLSTHANASLMSIDYARNSGDQWITRDSASGLDWLDVSLTTDQTFDQVRTGVWYQKGFRHATRQELLDLFLHAGTPDDGFDVSNTHPLETLALANMLGPTLVGGSRVTVTGFTGTDYRGNQITLSNHPVGSPFGALLGKVDYLSLYGEAHFTGGHPFSDQAGANYGSFLVRSVPEPSTTSIMLLAGLAMMASRKKRKQDIR